MKIAICGSMSFANEMLDLKLKLLGLGFKVALPEGVEEYATNKTLLKKISGWGTLEGARRKIKNDLIRKHYREIQKADAILVINKEKNGIKNYIGGNSFLEMGFAYILGKKIFLLNKIPEGQKVFYQEIVAMQPVVLNGNLRVWVADG